MADLDFNPADYLKSKQQAGSDIAKVTPIEIEQFDPKAYLQDKATTAAVHQQERSGGIGQQLLGGAEALARGRTLGGSDVALTQLSKSSILPDFITKEFTPERIKERQDTNPITSLVGSTVGSIPTVAAMGTLAGAAGAGALGAEALTGAGLGAGNAISEAALGDENLNAEKLLAHVGLGAAIGTGFGALAKAIKAVPAIYKTIRGAASEPSEGALEGNAATVLQPEAGQPGEPIVNVPTGSKATTYEELRKQVEDVKKYGGAENFAVLPQKEEAQKAAEALESEMTIPFTDMQINSLNSQDARLAYKTTLEVPGENGQVLRDSLVGQKKDLNRILDKTIDQIAPGYEPTTNAAEAGERASNLLTEQIQGVRDKIGPAIRQIKDTPLGEMDHLPGMIDYLTDSSESPYANPKIANMFETSGDSISVKPYTTSMGIDRGTYRALKEAVTSLEENPNDFEKLFDIRKGLSQNIDVTKLGDAAKEIGQAKAAMMDYIQDAVQSMDPDQAVRETFKKYAQNEANANLIEKTFGAEIGSGNFRSLAKGKAEESILKKIFANSATTQAVKDILPPEAFQKILADHIAVIKDEVTKQGEFSANRFMSKIGKGTSKYAIDEAFLNQPEVYNKLKTVLTGMQSFTDDLPINPSGTAKTLLQAIYSGIEHKGTLPKELYDFGRATLGKYHDRAEINAQLAGAQRQNAQLKTIQGIIKKVSSDISQGAKSIFSTSQMKNAGLSASVKMSDQKYEEIRDKLGDISANPTRIMDHMAQNTDDLHQMIPNTTEKMQGNVVNGYQFLQSKLPQSPSQFLLSQKWKPSTSQLNTFSKYYTALDQPLSALKQVSNGTLSNETMEALQAVHPQLLSQMRVEVMKHLKPEETQKLNYGKKVALSKFLGTPLDFSMTPQMVTATQMAYNPPATPQPGQPKKPRTNQSGLNKLKVSKRTATASNESEE
jgi:hypothetical protein